MRRILLVSTLALLLACGAGTAAADVASPASEPRETTHVLIDLKKTGSCTERFDLAVYQNRNIEMIAWQPDVAAGAAGQESGPDCEQRVAEVRFLSRHISKTDVLYLLRANAIRVTETTTKKP